MYFVKNIFLIGIFVIKVYNIRFVLGGIIGLIVDEVVVIVVENFFENFFFIILGINIFDFIVVLVFVELEIFFIIVFNK